MREDFFWTLLGGGFVVFWAILITVAQHLRATRRLRERELVHKERLLALEKGIPLPEDASASGVVFAASALRNLALAGGLLLLFGGLGFALACYFSSDRDSIENWTFGLIPGMAGLGLLLYVWIGRRLPAG